jgi:predicted nucleic acid-binding protein
MRTVFLDTVGLLASWDSTDQWHEPALDALGPDVRSFSTTFVMLECGNAAARYRYRSLVDEMRNALDVGGKLIRPTEEDWEHSWTAYRQGLAGEAGIVDQISFVIMRRMGITDVFTNDRHFKAAGFNTLF